MLKKVVGIVAVFVVFAAFVPALNAQWTNVLSEDFNGDWGTYANNPPAGWTINYTGTPNASDWYRYYWSTTSSYCARIYWNPYETAEDELISPVFDCSGMDQVYVAATHYYNHYSGAYTSQWRGSIDGGSSFPYVLYDYYQSTTGPQRDSILFPEAAGQSSVCINFYGSGNNYNLNYWYVDDVAVWVYEGGGGPSGDSLDLEMIQVIRPIDPSEGGVAVTPGCRIYNPADSVVSAEVRCSIKDLDLMQTVYEDVIGSYPLDPGYNAVEAFKDFTPEGNKNYEVRFVLEHPDDVNEQNNDVDKRFSTTLAQEVTPVAVISPDTNQYNAFMPKATYEERAGSESTDAILICSIDDGTYMATVYSDTTTYTFSANESTDIEFAEVTGLADGSYTITFWAEDSRGVVISDPILVRGFGYAGIAEEPVVERFGLTAHGSNVSFTLPAATTVSLRVYDVAGNVVADLASGTYSAGTHEVSFNANPGVYFVKMITPDFAATDKITIFK